MIKLPVNNQWTQPNNSYKMGSLWATKNITLDEEGIIKLSPRTVSLFDSSADVSNEGSTSFDIPTAFGATDSSTYYIVTRDEPFDYAINGVTKTIAEDTSSNNPNLNSSSHGVWWQGRFYESYDTGVSYNTAGTWTAGAITGLTSGVRHYLEVFRNKNSLAVTNGNTVKLYDTSHSNTYTLTMPSDFTATGLAYNNYRLGVITQANDGYSGNAFFFVWDGATSEASTGVDTGSKTIISVTPYKSSFALLTGDGRLIYWNGGGFDELAAFPVYYSFQRSSNDTTGYSYGDCMVVDGDTIRINVSFNIDGFGIRSEAYIQNNPSGVWCYDPRVGLYHQYSPSLSRAYLHNISSGNVDTGTGILTTTNTIPSTGNPLIVAGNGGSVLGGITTRKTYYVIKLSSTTFKIAETKEKALSGVSATISSAASNNYIWMYDIVDYGTSFTSTVGAIDVIGTSTDYITQIIGGSSLFSEGGTAYEYLFVGVPFIGNVGYFITPKIFLNSREEKIQSLILKHRPLDVNDKIIVKSKMKDYLGLPVTSIQSPSNNTGTWTSSSEFYTSADLSSVKTVLDSGEEIEIEILTGSGSGQMAKVTSISSPESGVTSVVLAEDIIGAGAGDKSNFIMDSWRVCEEINYSNQTEGVVEIPIAKNSKAPQFKIELQGIGTAVEEVMIINKSHIPAV